MYSQPHLIRTWLIGSSGSDQDFTPDNHCYDRQVASLSVITMAYQVRNLDHFLNSRLTRFRLSGVDCIFFCNNDGSGRFYERATPNACYLNNLLPPAFIYTYIVENLYIHMLKITHMCSLVCF